MFDKHRETLSIAEAAQRLGISRGHAYNLAHAGCLPSIRLGRRLLIPRLVVDRALAVPGAIAAAGLPAGSTGEKAATAGPLAAPSLPDDGPMGGDAPTEGVAHE